MKKFLIALAISIPFIANAAQFEDIGDVASCMVLHAMQGNKQYAGSLAQLANNQIRLKQEIKLRISMANEDPKAAIKHGLYACRRIGAAQ